MYSRPRWVIVFFIVAFLGARLTGAHLHLCLDGSEPLAQLHVSDIAEAEHHPHETQAHQTHPHEAHLNGAGSHEDVDVDALGDVLAKVAKVDLPAVVFVAWCLALLLVAVVLRPARFADRVPPLRPPRFLRPLLRGPPC